jgi:hypothetical protein
LNDWWKLQDTPSSIPPWPAYDAPRIAWAEAWRARGHRPIPLQAGTKRPVDRNWPQIPFHENPGLYFSGVHQNRNLGIACGEPHGFVDADLDCPEAVALWEEFYGPPTNLRYGRDQNPNSHWLYLSEPPILFSK